VKDGRNGDREERRQEEKEEIKRRCFRERKKLQKGNDGKKRMSEDHREVKVQKATDER